MLPEIEAQILPIKLHESPMKSTNIETFARKLRFQALGRACRNLGSSLLLLGHHYDDQAETLLMRMVDGHTARLTGIQKLANIPECYGLYGVSGSGSPLTIRPSKLPRDCGVTGLERGGIQLGRPLLDFSKNRLLATCQKLDMPWFEDETNKDKTLTSRNAVRHIVDKYRLPEALRSRSLIALSELKKQSAEGRERIANKLFDEMPLTLDLRSGVVIVEFPKLDSAMISPKSTSLEPSYLTRPIQVSALVPYMLVKRVAEFSYSGPHQTNSWFDDVVRFVYNIPRGGVRPFFRPTLKTETSLKVREASGLCFEHLDDAHSEEVSMKFKIYRAPPSQRETKLAHDIPSHANQRIAPMSERKPFQNDNFLLWDERYWIRSHNPAKHDLWVRKLDEDSLALLRTLLAAGRVVLRRQSDGEAIKDGRKYIKTLLREIAMGIIRWSLPVIVSYTPMAATTATSDEPLTTPQILAFPTLGLRVEAMEDGFWPPWVHDLKWEVRYKNVDLGNKKLEDCLIGGGKDQVGVSV